MHRYGDIFQEDGEIVFAEWGLWKRDALTFCSISGMTSVDIPSIMPVNTINFSESMEVPVWDNKLEEVVQRNYGGFILTIPNRQQDYDEETTSSLLLVTNGGGFASSEGWELLYRENNEAGEEYIKLNLSSSGSNGSNSNFKKIFTENGEVTIPYTGVYKITLVGGGGGAVINTSSGSYAGGSSGGLSNIFFKFSKGDVISITVGEGGNSVNSQLQVGAYAGGDTQLSLNGDVLFTCHGGAGAVGTNSPGHTESDNGEFYVNGALDCGGSLGLAVFINSPKILGCGGVTQGSNNGTSGGAIIEFYMEEVSNSPSLPNGVYRVDFSNPGVEIPAQDGYVYFRLKGDMVSNFGEGLQGLNIYCYTSDTTFNYGIKLEAFGIGDPTGTLSVNDDSTSNNYGNTYSEITQIDANTFQAKLWGTNSLNTVSFSAQFNMIDSGSYGLFTFDLDLLSGL
jgi:hypothetical protein